MPVAAKAFCVVTAGLIPGEPMAEFSRQWGYTSVDYDADRQRPEGTPSKFEQNCDEATKYARDLMDPSRLNWVKVEFVWV
ncbi:MAG TPA: hypothetical protein VJO99_07105 [Burkholderiaceae bacterium]|nr:hypothetical protein [Burkholderiaceae bacterium]